MVGGGGGSTRRTLGQRAEALASAYLQDRGYTIVARNWRRREGELDLVMSREGLCIFVEVRSRTGVDRGHPLETVNASKRAQIIRAACLYLDEEKPQALAFRFDVVGVTFSATDQSSVEIVHIEDAFQSG